MKTKLSKKFWLALVLFSFMGQVAWTVENMYLNVFIYKMFHASAGQISAMVAASAVAATLTTVFIGALSDKLGKRKIFICGGYILWGISILGFSLIRTDVIAPIIPATASAASVGVSLVIALDCVMTFFGSSANDAAFNAWLTDSTDATNRGSAEGINAMMPLMSILAVFGGFMAFDLNRAESWTSIFTIIGAVVLAIGVAGLFLIENPPIQPTKDAFWKTLAHSFLPSTAKKNRSLYLQLLCFVLFNISIQIFMPYLIIYYEVSLGMSDYVLIMAPAVVLASVATLFWGRAYDKKGFSFSVLLSLLCLCAGYLFLCLFQSKIPVFIGSLLMMSGFLSTVAVFGASIRDRTPVGKSGSFQGVRIVAQVLLPGVIGPYIGRMVLANAKTIENNDGTTSFVPNQNIFWAALAVAIVTLIVTMLVEKSTKKPRLQTNLKTPFEDDSTSSWQDYPRPQMKRDSYLSLVGEWELLVKTESSCTPVGKIKVPFPPESRLSGIERALGKGEHYLYRRTFALPEDFCKECLLLHFGAVDQKATVRVNGREIGTHVGGYLPFSFDIASYVTAGENTVEVEVEDTLDMELPYGKQCKKRGGMWYTPISGIWQPVWLESVPQNHIQSLKIDTTLTEATVTVQGGQRAKTLILHTEDGDERFSFEDESITVSPKIIHLWTPDSPYLYRFTVTDGKDTVNSYFALRTVEVGAGNGKPCILLNGKPIFCHGLLDQGYYSDGIYLPATPKGFLFDILKMKECGFNMLRKHIKIEPQIFYYYCDKYGMLVFQDMVNSGRYHYLLDTVLPTVGKKTGITHRSTAFRKAFFEEHSAKTVELLYNHPSVIYYTVFNEGWGQYEADRVYTLLKEQDRGRVWDATSGWFWESKTDVKSEHIYFRPIKLSPSDKPLVLSEFGGYSCKIPQHSFNLDKTYGYRFFEHTEDFMKAMEQLYREQVMPATENGLCAAVLTQVSDIEDETNGLLTYDRQVLKVDTARMKALSEELYAKFEQEFLNK